MNTAPKAWYESRAVWGGIVTAGAGIAGLAGYDVDKESLTDILLGIGGLVGSALAIWGRVQATRPISRPGLEAATERHHKEANNR